MTMAHRSFLPLAAAALVLALFAVGCGDEGMRDADVRRAANEVRQPLRNSLGDQIYMTWGTGGFTECADRNAKDSLVYIIDEPFEGKSERQTDEQFVAMVRGRLSAVGWKLKPAGNKIQSAEKDGINVQLRLLHRTAGDGALARLVVLGRCTNVGQAKDDVIGYYSGSKRDEYRSSSASPTPVPTTFPDLHAVP